jgi:hypothetical protein
MSAHRVLHDAFNAPFLMTDPGASGTITVDRWYAVVPIVSAATETRTLAQPTKAGLVCKLQMDDYVGAVTVTVTGGYNTAADTAIVLNADGDWVLFSSIKVGTSYYWRVVKHEATDVIDTGGGTVSSQTITSLTATNANATTGIFTTANATTASLTNTTVGRLQVATTTVNAAGTNIANAGALSYGMNKVLLADNATGVILPVAVANGCVEVLQTVNAKSLLVYPQVNSTIAGLSANAALNTGTANTAADAGTATNIYRKFLATNATQWYASL